MIGFVATTASSQAFRARCSTGSLRGNPILNLMSRWTKRSKASSKLRWRSTNRRDELQPELIEPGNVCAKARSEMPPSIFAANLSRWGEQVAEAERCGADRIHVDVMDGHFVPNISFGAVM